MSIPSQRVHVLQVGLYVSDHDSCLDSSTLFFLPIILVKVNLSFILKVLFQICFSFFEVFHLEINPFLSTPLKLPFYGGLG